MKKKLCLVFLGAAFLGLSMTALANTVTITYTGQHSGTYNGTATGVYKGTLNGAPANFICDDYHDHLYPNVPWQADVFKITDIANNAPDFAAVTFGPKGGSNAQNTVLEPTQLQSYAEAMWIANQLFQHPTTNANVDSYAIWEILNKNYVGMGPAGTAAEITAAENWWNGNGCSANDATCIAQVSNLFIYVPVSWSTTHGKPQEMFGTPEPMSMLLLGTFLSLGGGLLNRKKRA